MKEIKAIRQPPVLDRVLDALHRLDGVPETTIGEVSMHGVGRRRFEPDRRYEIEAVEGDETVEREEAAIRASAHTGNPGDGGVFVNPVEQVVDLRADPDLAP